MSLLKKNLFEMEKCILITGSSKGLGEALANVFAKNGYNVILHGRDKESLEKIKKSLTTFNVSCKIVIGDLLSDSTLDELSRLASENNVSILINNAGIGEKAPLELISEEEIEKTIFINLIVPIKLTKRIYKLFLERKQGGLIVNINSVLGLENKEQQSIYSASKWGLRGFANTFKLEAQKNNVHILNIYPSRIKTRPEFTVGMEKKEVAEKIFNAVMEMNNSDLIIDGRKELK